MCFYYNYYQTCPSSYLNKQNATTLPIHSSHGLSKTHQDGKSEFYTSQSQKIPQLSKPFTSLPYIKTVNKMRNEISTYHELLRYLSA